MDDRREQFEQLSAYLDGELTADQALGLERALAEDAELAAELDSLRKTRQLLRDMPAEPAPDGFAHDVMARWWRMHPVGREGAGRPLRASRWISIAATAVVLFAAGAGMYIVVNLPQEPPTAELATGPDVPIIVADLPAEHIFTADLDAAGRDVADMLARNGVPADYVRTAGRRDALDVPTAGVRAGLSQAVQVAADTVEIEVLVEPAVARRILTELESVQLHQLPPTNELIEGAERLAGLARQRPPAPPMAPGASGEPAEHRRPDGQSVVEELAEGGRQLELAAAPEAAEPPADTGAEHAEAFGNQEEADEGEFPAAPKEPSPPVGTDEANGSGAVEDVDGSRAAPSAATGRPSLQADKSGPTRPAERAADRLASNQHVRLQRLVIVLRRVPADELPAQVSQRAGELRQRRLRAASIPGE